MTAKNLLLQAPPFAVEQAVKHLGNGLRVARIRRGLTIADAARKIGAGVRAVADAEKGKPTTSIAVYAALLWAYDLLGPLESLSDPSQDKEGEALALAREPVRARARRGLDNDF